MEVRAARHTAARPGSTPAPHRATVPRLPCAARARDAPSAYARECDTREADTGRHVYRGLHRRGECGPCHTVAGAQEELVGAARHAKEGARLLLRRQGPDLPHRRVAHLNLNGGGRAVGTADRDLNAAVRAERCPHRARCWGRGQPYLASSDAVCSRSTYFGISWITCMR